MCTLIEITQRFGSKNCHFLKKLCDVLVAIGFTQSNEDPWLFSQLTDHLMIYVAVYVDDCYVAGDDHAIDKLIVDLQSHAFKLKIEDKPTDY